MSGPKLNIESGTLPSFDLNDSDIDSGIEISADQFIQMKEVEARTYQDIITRLQTQNENLERQRDEARELARELLDALENCREDSVELLGEWDWKRGGGTRNRAQYEELEGRVSLADSVIDKAKEVLP